MVVWYLLDHNLEARLFWEAFKLFYEKRNEVYCSRLVVMLLVFVCYCY
jgi:hypothetical protein